MRSIKENLDNSYHNWRNHGWIRVLWGATCFALLMFLSNAPVGAPIVIAIGIAFLIIMFYPLLLLSRNDMKRVKKLNDSDYMRTSKMYILIREEVDPGHAVLGAAHASLAGYLEFKDDLDVQCWRKHSFRKVVCKVSAKEFEKAKSYDIPYRIMTEMALPDIGEVGLVFKPSESYPRFFQFLKLWNI